MEKSVPSEQVKNLKKKCSLAKFAMALSKNPIPSAHTVEQFLKKKRKKSNKSHHVEDHPDQRKVEDHPDQRKVEGRPDQRKVEDHPDQRKVEDHPVQRKVEDHLGLRNQDHLAGDRRDQRRVEDHQDLRNQDHPVEGLLGQRSQDHPVEGRRKEVLLDQSVARLDEGRSYDQKSQ